ncbi:MAG: hypothetical protein WCY29_17460 [Novosphingobium sp.]
MKKLLIGLMAVSVCTPALAQNGAAEPMTVASVVSAAPQLVLPANTEVSLRMNDTITSKGNSFNQGDTFGLTVAQNVYLDDYVVIPAGSRATGRITFLTSKGAFGKSGKMEISVEYVEVNGRRIPLEGTYRQEGEGNTVATVGGVIAAGVFAGFVTGKSATIPQGRELTARTKQDLPIRVAARPSRAPVVPAYTEVPVQSYVQTSSGQPSMPVKTTKANWGLVPVTK